MSTANRHNEGKPDYSLIDSKTLYYGFTISPPNSVMTMLDHLSNYQFTGDRCELGYAVECCVSALNGSPDNKYSVLDPLVKVLEFGAKKYSPFNWAEGMKWSIPIACVHRHLLMIYSKGEQLDSESGQPHIAHVMANLLMLIYYHDNNIEGNDLPFSVLNSPSEDEVVDVESIEKVMKGNWVNDEGTVLWVK